MASTGVALIAAIAAIGLVACSPPTAPSSTAPPSSSAHVEDPTVEIVQGRLDWGARVVSLVITLPEDERPDDAGEDDEIEVVAAALDSPAWDGTTPKDPDRTVTLAPGRTRSMFVALGDARCDPTPDGTPEASAHLTLRPADGPDVTREVAVTDPYGHLARAWAEDCARAGAAGAVDLVLGEDVAAGEHDGVATGTIMLTVRPHEADTGITLTGVRGTQLLAPLGGDPGWAVPAMTNPDDDGVTVPLTFTAVRCDQHAIAEDKRGTYLGIETTRDGVAQPVFYSQLPETTRRALMAWYADACGWPSTG